MKSLELFEQFPIDFITFHNHDIKSFCWSWLRELNLCIPTINYKTNLDLDNIENGKRIMILENWDGMLKRGFTPEFCKKKELRFVVILSEHLTIDHENDDEKVNRFPKLPINNLATNLLSTDKDMERVVSFNNFSKTSSNISREFQKRTELLKKYDKFVDFYCTIGELPKLEPWKEFFNRPKSNFIKIPINTYGLENIKNFKLKPKILFTGQLTSYRANLISELIKNGLDIEVFPIQTFDFRSDSEFFVKSLNDEIKNEFYSKYDYVLDIPKDKDWPYSSTMRILDALRQNTRVIVGNTYVDEDIKNYTVTIKEILSKFKNNLNKDNLNFFNSTFLNNFSNLL